MADDRSRSRSRSPQRRRSPIESDRRRDRSRSPRRNDRDARDFKRRSRSRSRSPRRRDEGADSKKKDDFSKAFKFKSKDKKQDSRDDDRDYRRREDDNYRPRRYGGKDDRDRNTDRNRDRDRRDDRDSKVADKFGGSNVKDKFGNSSNIKDKFGDSAPKDKPKAAPAPTVPVTYILVTVNDRLGTKATIPALPSDTVGDFKKMVAAHIGRQPHEIMLKRQGERPFKDFITLGDYGVSSGVQLDLELDTGE